MAKVKTHFEIKNGMLDGLTTFYYPDGQKKEQRSYREGAKYGAWINWSPSGVKIAEANFLNNQKHGDWFIWDEKGNLRQSTWMGSHMHAANAVD